ncbi:homeobox-leucine zipper protein ATHB-17-like [Olea europaea var. sylvestris]|uniref:homeobox-leucine zipper protein ATHB-17-like n=1 Tax=Olea europaea var. sylvestris TaxID=158386 RepID=UPI000C1CF163|nr:homeobox-leucine zipper protein ATHB-17-like [Olea europaea var. sylvestris]
MEISSDDFSCLELTIAMPGFSSSPSPQSYGERMEEEYETQNPRKKLRLTKDQSRVLEESFRQNHTLNPKQKEGLAEQLKLKPRQVEVWFQNRRARCMRISIFIYLFLSGTICLNQFGRRLKKEVEELRGMNVRPPNISQQQPAATLTMCPRCERVATTFLDKGPATTTSTTPTKIIQPSAAC